MMKTGKIFGVSLGPGDPELITVKGLNILKNADKVYYPGSHFKDGSKASYAKSIINCYGLDESRLQGFYLKMSDDRTQAQSVYDEIASQIWDEYVEGKNIAIISEGDLSTFSSFSYLLARLENAGANIDLVPGITSYALAAAEHKKPLTLGEDRMLILPRVRSVSQLCEALDNFETVVLMKIRSIMHVIEEVLEDRMVEVFYAERLGTEQQFTTENWLQVASREVPYFSLMILKK
ncbi:precorrin-2 C(20)-methyltransferase [Aureibacter tunicatorum]|uniref:Precorrin-2/cobalt-factor-2 C20-methyltransferase n=1 Tax=Aureibacter tunicatorum TaxID=866807 RepID=A0AAE3XJG2_9BACT|nr:precorrin-2 C(20)-methyltransferase [Aureibacter tunicatorum]MDR6237545.1 precorrin-2/cobalt-factor-2 C20-methyltransferase [Aureibacter tunicatorum]BDD02579.1 precorrin-2 C(20)-methyltransferase [Aureibacter tunicatorum]